MPAPSKSCFPASLNPPHLWCLSVLPLDNPSQVGSVPVTIKVLDVNDNAPEFPRFYEAFVCENAKAGQVSSLSTVVSLPTRGNHYIEPDWPSEEFRLQKLTVCKSPRLLFIMLQPLTC